jgi:UDP-N-acetyl-D-glucosamine/UDP-N-acetyl-D-galactosamine dehydrogenase
MINNHNTHIAVIGLGYVGLPLAVEFGKKYETIGFDINKSRINELMLGNDSTLELESDELMASKKLRYSFDISDIRCCNFYIITVPTPIDEKKNPDLSLLVKASKNVAKILSVGDIVIYESTVYPGATEEVCIPILEQYSGLTFNEDFTCGYSPERINPGDKEHRVYAIKKVTSGSNQETANIIDELYKTIISAGTYKAESIKVAEAAKVIENTQRDINIALINELSMIFNRLNIDTEAVLNAAGSKWNFLPFRPGLVGGHCIGIDPYYLTHKAIEVGYKPEMILAGRRLNDNMGRYIVDRVVSLMNHSNISVEDSNLLIMGLAFKENCPDIRNTKVIDIFTGFKKLLCHVDIYDPWVDKDEAKKSYNIKLINQPEPGRYDAIVIAVAHDDFKKLSKEDFRSLGKDNHVIYDVKYLLGVNDTEGRL